MVVYAFEWCYCVYEGHYVVESLHATKKGAYREDSMIGYIDKDA